MGDSSRKRNFTIFCKRKRKQKYLKTIHTHSLIPVQLYQLSGRYKNRQRVFVASNLNQKLLQQVLSCSCSNEMPRSDPDLEIKNEFISYCSKRHHNRKYTVQKFGACKWAIIDKKTKQCDLVWIQTREGILIIRYEQTKEGIMTIRYDHKQLEVRGLLQAQRKRISGYHPHHRKTKIFECHFAVIFFKVQILPQSDYIINGIMWLKDCDKTLIKIERWFIKVGFKIIFESSVYNMYQTLYQ